jgi:cell division protein FtsW
MVSLAYGVGMMLALTRQRPQVDLESMNASAAQGYA